MYCAHQQWLIAPEIDYFGGEGDSLLVRAEIARDRPRVEVVQDSLRPFQSAVRVGMKSNSLLRRVMTRARVPPDSLLRYSHKALSFFVLAAFNFRSCCVQFSFLLRSFFVLSAFNSFDIQLNQI